MISNDIDLPRWRDDLARRGRTQVTGYLQPDAAQLLQQCLLREVPWTLAYREAAGPRTLPHAELASLGPTGEQALLERCYSHAQSGYAFAYESYMMVTAYKEGRDPDLLLHRVLEFFNSPDYIGFARALTGDPGIRKINAQATRYRAGHFLRRHNDFDADEGRRYAYVLNLTPTWEPDWGGQLQFFDEAGNVVETLMPRFNSLSIFKVPAMHAVTLVAPWARAPRIAITGWMLGA